MPLNSKPQAQKTLPHEVPWWTARRGGGHLCRAGLRYHPGAWVGGQGLIQGTRYPLVREYTLNLIKVLAEAGAILGSPGIGGRGWGFKGKRLGSLRV